MVWAANKMVGTPEDFGIKDELTNKAVDKLAAVVVYDTNARNKVHLVDAPGIQFKAEKDGGLPNVETHRAAVNDHIRHAFLDVMYQDRLPERMLERAVSCGSVMGHDGSEAAINARPGYVFSGTLDSGSHVEKQVSMPDKVHSGVVHTIVPGSPGNVVLKMDRDHRKGVQYGAVVPEQEVKAQDIRPGDTLQLSRVRDDLEVRNLSSRERNSHTQEHGVDR